MLNFYTESNMAQLDKIALMDNELNRLIEEKGKLLNEKKVLEKQVNERQERLEH